ncbi:MAG: right-handed parallel beta-helix repeat-containing protein [Myxococcota bacterium]
MSRVAAVVAAVAGCGGGDDCDLTALQGRLDGANAGDVVRFGTCILEGNLQVPAGVILEGPGEEGVLRSSTGHGVTLAEGAFLRRLRLESSGETAVLVRDASAVVEDLSIVATRGAGVAVQGGSATLRRVSMTGEVDDPDAPRFVRVAGFAAPGPCPSEPCTCEPGTVEGDQVCDSSGEWATWTAVYGLYVRSASVVLEDVSASGFAEVGAALIDAEVQWTGGAVEGNLGVGVFVQRGEADLRELRVAETAEGLRGLAAYAVLVSEATVDSERLMLDANERYGLLTLDSQGSHGRLEARGNGDVGVWIGGSDEATLSDAVLADNGFAGVVVSESRNVMLQGSEITGTRTVRRTLGDLFGAQEIGDGVHLAASESVVLERITLNENARSGLVVDLSVEAPTFREVSVEVGAEGTGAVAGTLERGTLTLVGVGGWDDGIARSAAAEARDLGVAGVLDAVGVNAPPSAPERAGAVFPMF